MNLRRWKIGIMGMFLGVVSVQAAPVKVGLFGLSAAEGIKGPIASGEMLAFLTSSLRQELEVGLQAQVIPLALPANRPRGSLPNLETYLGIGKAAGCDGLLVWQATALQFSAREFKLPLVGKVNVGNAEMAVTGGLLDVATATGIAPVSISRKLDQKPLRGPAPAELQRDPSRFTESLLGAVWIDVRRQIVAALRGGVPRLTPGTGATMPERGQAPAGVGFSEESYSLTVPKGFDGRATIAVVNRGKSAESFVVVPLSQPEHMVAGLLGAGSMDAPCTLQPGEWKYVRLVANTALEGVQGEFELGLYAARPGGVPSRSGKPQDVVKVRLRVNDPRGVVTLSVLAQDPATLAYTCQLNLVEGMELSGLSIVPAKEQQGMVRFTPDVSRDIRLITQPGRNAVLFTAMPLFSGSLREIQVTMECRQRGRAIPLASLPLSFSIPAGKRMFYGLGRSISAAASMGGYCTNQGGIDLGAFLERQKEEFKRQKEAEQARERMHEIDSQAESQRANTSEEMKKKMEDMIRGGVVRPLVAARIPGLERGSYDYPIYLWSDTHYAQITLGPEAEGSSRLIGGIFARGQDEGRRRGSYVDLIEPGHLAKWPHARLSPLGKVAVVWEDTLKGKSDVALRRGNLQGGNWEAVQYLTRHAAGVEDPVVQFGSGREMIAAWVDRRGADGRIYLRTSRDDGATFSPEIALPKAPGETQAWPQVAATPDGKWALAFVSRMSGGSRVLAQRLMKDGRLEGAPVKLSQAQASAGEPQIAADPTGRLFSAWREGEGAESEIWLAACPPGGTSWKSPVRITNDRAYSEYPVLGVSAGSLWLAYHSDLGGVADFSYLVESTDGGNTWSTPWRRPSLAGHALRSWVEALFTLEHERSRYAPHTTRILVNGTEVGKLPDTIPEGIYLFEVPPGLIQGNAGHLVGNVMQIKTEMMNPGHYLYLSRVRLIAGWPYSLSPVIAANQAEADELAQQNTPFLNHTLPDVALVANLMPVLPGRPLPVKPLELTYQVANIGEAPASQVVVRLFSQNPEDPKTDLEKAGLGEQAVGSLASGETRTVTFRVPFDFRGMEAVYGTVTLKETDGYPLNNSWVLHFASGASQTSTPLLGTDIPKIFNTPDLFGMVSVPDPVALSDLLSRPNFSELVRVPGLVPPEARVTVQRVKATLFNRLPNLANEHNLLPF